MVDENKKDAIVAFLTGVLALGGMAFALRTTIQGEFGPVEYGWWFAGVYALSQVFASFAHVSLYSEGFAKKKWFFWFNLFVSVVVGLHGSWLFFVVINMIWR